VLVDAWNPIRADTMTTDSEIPLRVTRDHALAQEWELVLVAQGLSPSVHQTSDGILLSVPEKELERALASLSAYERENPAKLAERDEPIAPAAPLAGTLVAAMLLVFFFLTVSWNPSVPWFERGSADADRILRGELWRTVTALTLHADLVHVLSNAIATAVFLGAVYGTLGVGLGSAVVLLAGAGGNLANALLHGSSHVSVGASTAIFGSVGLLGSFGMVRRRRTTPGRRAWLPVAAALALLAILGTGGQRVDILAHLFGFLLGGVLGILFAFVAPDPPRQGVQWLCGFTALALLIYCWTLALG
jgi:membrane associated rhomboid family serine protease